MHRLRKTYRSKRIHPGCLRSAYSSKTFQRCPAFSRLKSIVSSVHVTYQIPEYWAPPTPTAPSNAPGEQANLRTPLLGRCHKPLQPLSLRTSYSYMPRMETPAVRLHQGCIHQGLQRGFVVHDDLKVQTSDPDLVHSFSRSPDITTIPSMPVANITRMSTFQYFPLPKKRKSAPRPSGSASFRIRRAGVLPLAWTQAPQPAS